MNSIQKALKARYSHIHPLLFQRALEKAGTDGELFDLLETMPDQHPIVWDEEKQQFVTTDDLFQKKGKSDG